ncbi:phosphatase PAP2 family protein [Paenibacillus sp. FSL R7-0204]|uniref:phosphatase PAP2 family protein n=1 Tax=unclassified Paenibacillus TaxID=185978 RepID=UPI0003E23655|nr:MULTISPECIES: phosphatase PAP2 family protein [unclassified Paenibacillus]ETT47221.1 PAP2 family protein [Paenibacillus sp. FSL R7-269]OMF89203.1 phosphatase PAP2 family protein [Paenibacillus sp. FSL R7-0337]
MRPLFKKLHLLEQRVFQWINGRMHNPFLNFWLFYLTHLGGATSAIGINLLVWAVCPQPWRTTGLQALAALAISHVPVAIAKKLYPRLRPYLALPDTNTFRNPLKDHSFPSGHTTAIFASTVPYMIAYPVLTAVLLPLACTVGFSRIYLGLHYPSDVLAGAVIGSGVAAGTLALWI